MSRDPPPINPTIYRLTSASALSMGNPLLAGYNSSPYSTASSSPRQVPQLVLQKSNLGPATLSPEDRGRNVGLGESEDLGPYISSPTTTQGPSSDTDCNRSGKEQEGQSDRHTGRKESRKSTGQSGLSSPTLVDPGQPPEFNEPEDQGIQVHGSTRGAGKPRTNLPNAFGSKNASKRDFFGTGSRELSAYTNTCIGAEIVIDPDLNQGSSSAFLRSFDHILVI